MHRVDFFSFLFAFKLVYGPSCELENFPSKALEQCELGDVAQ